MQRASLRRLAPNVLSLSALCLAAGLDGGCTVDSGGTGGGVDTGSDMNLGADGGARPDATGDTPAPFCEADDNLGEAVGPAVVTGSTAGAEDSFTPHCSYNSTAGNRAYRWIAPLTAVFSIDTLGSDFDTVLYVLNSRCEGRPVACNDEVRPGKKVSEVRISAEKDERFVIVVDGYRDAEGDFVLNILEEPAASEALFCADGLDNDRDGDTDCADYECREAENCGK